MRQKPAARAPAQLTRVTQDSGLTTDPALSPDGRMVAYASDRGGENLDIWVQHLAGGDPVRLTQDPADDSEPSFSPDGGKIAFRSGRDGGGIYVVPVLGGEARLVARNGLRPRFSPDGTLIAYDVGALGSASGTTLRKTYVAPAGGGTPKEVATELTSAAQPVWSPDGKYLALIGRGASGPLDWYVAPVGGGPAVPMGMKMPSVRRRFDARPPSPEAWSNDGGSILYSASGGDSVNLWRVRFHPKTFQITGNPEQITFGTGVESQPALAAKGLLALYSTSFSSDQWNYPLDANRGKVTGEIQRITQDAAIDERAVISADGALLAWASDRSGNPDIWVRDLRTGKDRALTSTPESEYWPCISADGSKISYSDPKGSISVVSASGGVPEKICEQRCGSNWDLSRDGTTALFGASLGPLRIGKLGAGPAVEVLKHPSYSLLSPKFSPDARWLVLHVRNSELTRRIFVVPFRPGAPPPESEWIPVTDGLALDRDPQWSPDGGLIYWLSDRDGFRCIAARRIDPAAKRPVGEMFWVAHFHSARRSMMPFSNTGATAPAIAPGKMIFALGERTGNIWLTKIEK
ncbi:MAG: PD40 domain-containing protein [Candidatus Solibacter usitatus]|nr:PD40 domain-containing protein [Candidatus Solibacter usitatus]